MDDEQQAPPPETEAAPPPAAELIPAPSAAPGAPRPRRAAWAPLVLLLAGLGGGWWLGHRSPRLPPAPPLAQSISQVERQVAPAVVTIRVETPSRQRNGFYRLPPGLQAPRRRPNERSLGSGLIVDARGYIVTNRHVVHRAQRIEVSIPGDNHVYFAQLVGEDRETDLAVIKIAAPRALPVAHLGDSNQLAVGDWVVAIGSPFGLEASVTTGIVSALHRALDPTQQFEDFIQTDAPVNPGNSGGPLIDLHGDVIGINTAIYSDGDAYQGVAFALPSDLVNHVYPQLLRQGYVTRGSIGIYFEASLDPAVRRVYHLDHGVPLSQVTPHGPAEAAGMRAGDVIVSLDGAPVSNGDALMRVIADSPVGRRIQVGFERDGQMRTATMAVGDRARLFAQPGEEQPPAPPTATPAAADFGLELQPTPSGPRVRSVLPDTFADRIGISPDDVVTEINHTQIRQPADVARAAAAVRPGEDVAVVVRRPNGDGTVSRWLLGGTLPPSYSRVRGGARGGGGQ